MECEVVAASTILSVCAAGVWENYMGSVDGCRRDAGGRPVEGGSAAGATLQRRP